MKTCIETRNQGSGKMIMVKIMAMKAREEKEKWVILGIIAITHQNSLSGILSTTQDSLLSETLLPIKYEILRSQCLSLDAIKVRKTSIEAASQAA